MLIHSDKTQSSAYAVYLLERNLILSRCPFWFLWSEIKDIAHQSGHTEGLESFTTILGITRWGGGPHLKAFSGYEWYEWIKTKSPLSATSTALKQATFPPSVADWNDTSEPPEQWFWQGFVGKTNHIRQPWANATRIIKGWEVGKKACWKWLVLFQHHCPLIKSNLLLLGSDWFVLIHIVHGTVRHRC